MSDVIPPLMPNPYSDLPAPYNQQWADRDGIQFEKLLEVKDLIPPELYLSEEEQKKIAIKKAQEALEAKIEFDRYTGHTIYRDTKIMGVLQDCVSVMEPLHANTMNTIIQKLNRSVYGGHSPIKTLSKSDHRQAMKLIARYALILEQGDDQFKLRLLEAFKEGTALDKVADQWHKDYLLKKDGDIKFVPKLTVGE